MDDVLVVGHDWLTSQTRAQGTSVRDPVTDCHVAAAALSNILATVRGASRPAALGCVTDDLSMASRYPVARLCRRARDLLKLARGECPTLLRRDVVRPTARARGCPEVRGTSVAVR